MTIIQVLKMQTTTKRVKTTSIGQTSAFLKMQHNSYFWEKNTFPVGYILHGFIKTLKYSL